MEAKKAKDAKAPISTKRKQVRNNLNNNNALIPESKI
jgi:hypothetical protein